MTSIAPPESNAYHLRNGWPFRSSRLDNSTVTEPIGSFLDTASQSWTLSVSDGCSLPELGERLH